MRKIVYVIKLFTVLPKRNPEEIKVKLEGAKGLNVNNDGELEVLTELGSVKFTKPIAYQEIGGERKSIEVAYIIDKDSTYGFKVGNYDKKGPLIIDLLLASTFIGSNNYDMGQSLSLDGSYVYVTGRTWSSDFPTTSGA